MVPESPASPPENGARNDSAPSMCDRDELAARDALSSGLNARSVVGKGMERFSALVNDNIVAARYGVFATVALLTVSPTNIDVLIVDSMSLFLLPLRVRQNPHLCGLYRIEGVRNLEYSPLFSVSQRGRNSQIIFHRKAAFVLPSCWRSP